MKNIHVIPSRKPIGIHLLDYHITSDEEIKDVRPHKDKWQLEKGSILNKFPDYLTDLSECKLVIMTTDPDLIADGVQAIDDEFLQWFVKNPSCEEVETKVEFLQTPDNLKDGFYYKIIIPSKEPEQETIEEAAAKELEYIHESARGFDFDLGFKTGMVNGAAWQAERMYSKEKVNDLLDILIEQNMCSVAGDELIQQFKKQKS